MTNQDDVGVITNEFAMFFGLIISIFATIEHQMMICAAGILGCDLATAYILMNDTHYRQKQQTLRHLNTTRGINGYINQELIAILDELHNQSKLRNWICHAIWTTGNLPNSIKPMQLVLRSKEPKPLGHYHNEKSYTLSDLEECGRVLDTLQRRFNELLDSTGLRDKVSEAINATAASNDASPGSPNSK